MKAVSAQVVSCCVYDNPPPRKNVKHIHGNIQYMFDCWADTVVHLRIQKISMASLMICLGWVGLNPKPNTVYFGTKLTYLVAVVF